VIADYLHQVWRMFWYIYEIPTFMIHKKVGDYGNRAPSNRNLLIECYHPCMLQQKTGDFDRESFLQRIEIVLGYWQGPYTLSG
jgi:hypothetical protein